VAKVTQRSAYSTLPKPRLVELAEYFDLDISSREPKAAFVDRLASSKRASFEKVLDVLTVDELKGVLDAHGLGHDDANKDTLQHRILGYERLPADEDDDGRRKRRDKGQEFELEFRDYMKSEKGFQKVHHDVICKGKVADRPHQCDLHGIQYSLAFRALTFVGIAVFVLALAALAFPDDLGEVKNTADTLVAKFDRGLVQYSLLIVGAVAWIVAYVGKWATATHVWVECKNRRGRVKRDDINKLHIAVEDAKEFEEAKWRPDEVWLVSTTEFDQDALNFADEHGIRCYVWQDGRAHLVQR